MAKTVYNPRPQYAAFPVYRGLRQQRGHGIGGLFRGLFRTVVPMLKTVLKKGMVRICKRALTAGASALANINENKRAKAEISAPNPINRIKVTKLSAKPRKRAPKKRTAKRKKVNTFRKYTL